VRGCRPLTDREVEVVGKSFGGIYAKRNKALFILGLKTGYRITELLSLRVSDVYQHEKVTDRVTVQRRNMKGKLRSRTVILHPVARAALSVWLEQLQKRRGPLSPDTYLFRSHKGDNRPISRVQAWRILHDAYAANELTGKVATHSLRKTFAHNVYEASGRNIVRTMKAIGHANVATTMHYLDADQEEVDAAILAA
jgi:integrase